MADKREDASGSNAPVVVSIDAMGGDHGPQAVIAGIAQSAGKNGDIRFIVHGPAAEIDPLIRKQGIVEICEIRDVPGVVAMTDKPSHVLRRGQDTSMWSAIEAVRAALER